MVRKLRKVKRERTIAYQLLDVAMKQRDQARFIAGALEKELKARENSTNMTVIPEPDTDLVESKG